MLPAVYRAIMEERERCAKIAEDRSIEPVKELIEEGRYVPVDSCPGIMIKRAPTYRLDFRKAIANAIRGGIGSV